MSGISNRVSSHFGTTIELRLSQAEPLVNSVPPGRVTGDTSMRIEPTRNARSAGFEYLAFYTDDGRFDRICGPQVKADVPEDLRESVRGGKYSVRAGTDAYGTPVALMGVPAVYPMGGGKASIALVAGLPISYLSDTPESNIQSSFIRPLSAMSRKTTPHTQGRSGPLPTGPSGTSGISTRMTCS